MSSNLLITCPVCGYTFKNENIRPEKKELICPMCRYQFKDPNFPSERVDDFII
jgi:uncharacterized protein (DUF2225 family)